MMPFRVNTSDEELAELKRRVAATRWPDRQTVDDWSQGVPLAYAKELADHWATGYDWREAERRLNSWPQFRHDGIHFLHVRSPHGNALPLLLTHGWPGSVIEFLDIIEPLVNDPDDPFHLVIPSMPGFGYSDKPATTGMTVQAIASKWAALMARLGYERYGAHGGDLGSFVSAHLGHIEPSRVAGVHLTMPFADAPPPQEQVRLTERDHAGLAFMKAFQQKESGYSAIMSTKPQTLGYGLTDSPAGQLAWIAEKYWTWTDHPGDDAGAFEKVVPRDKVLDTVTLYWLTATAVSSARLYWESHYKVPNVQVDVPVGCLLFPKDARMPKAWCERRFTDLRRWTDAESGGHFPAFEQPEFLVSELRAFFRTVRQPPRSR